MLIIILYLKGLKDMQKLNFKKLVKLKVVQLVNPSVNLRKSYLEKSDESISSSKILHKNRQYNDAASEIGI